MEDDNFDELEEEEDFEMEASEESPRSRGKLIAHNTSLEARADVHSL